MPTDWQLRWVHANRQRRWQARRVGEWAWGLLSGRGFRYPKNRAKIAKVLESVLGSSLADHCVVGELISGVLTVYVDEPSALHDLRSRSQAALLQGLEDLQGGQKVRGIQFLFFADGEVVK